MFFICRAIKLMRNKFSLKEIKVFISLIVITIILTIVSFSFKIYSNHYNKIIARMEVESERIDRTFVNIFDHTGYIMKIISTQIISNYEDVNYINNILTKYRATSDISTVLSWSMFAWADRDGNILVESMGGLFEPNSNIAERTYIKKSKLFPGKIFCDQPLVNIISNREIIPCAIGVADYDDEYVGSVTIGFDVGNLKDILKTAMKSSRISFVVIGKNNNLILKSAQSNFVFPEINGKLIPGTSLERLAQESFASNDKAVYSSLWEFLKGENYYLFKTDHFPYIVYMHYNNKFIEQNLWHNITSRLIEIIIFGGLAISIITFIFHRESRLRREAEIAREEAEAASSAKSDFLAYTAHELRSPIGFIVTSTELLKNQSFGELSPKYCEYMINIHQTMLNINDFIIDLLDKMQSEQGKFHIKPAKVDLIQIINEALTTNSLRLNENNIKVELDIPEPLPFFNLDAKRIVQILDNLINNSVKYSPMNTKIMINVLINKKQELVIKFADQGYGMDKSEIKTALSKYGVVKHVKATNVESVGLGLSIVKLLVEAHAATLFIDSIKDKGTIMKIVFPKSVIIH